jgi:hypothetical protein
MASGGLNGSCIKSGHRDVDLEDFLQGHQYRSPRSAQKPLSRLGEIPLWRVVRWRFLRSIILLEERPVYITTRPFSRRCFVPPVEIDTLLSPVGQTPSRAHVMKAVMMLAEPRR